MSGVGRGVMSPVNQPIILLVIFDSFVDLPKSEMFENGGEHGFD